MNSILIIIGIIVLLFIVIVVWLGLIVYGFGSSFAYTEKEIGNELKGFLGYDFGKEFEVLKNETRVHGDRPVHFVIRIPKEAMIGVEDFCRINDPNGYTPDSYQKSMEYKDGGYVIRREYMTIDFKDCVIDFSGASC